MEIPLFPLRSVLFPGMALPLRVFEERYRVMVRELLDSGGVFGVLLIREGGEVGGNASPYDVGTTARIEQCTPLEGGRFAITARGVERFRLVRMLPPRPYPFGEIELLPDDDLTASPRLQHAAETVRATFPVYFRLALSLTGQWARSPLLPASGHRLVDAVAPWLQVTEEAKQRLIEPEATVDRMALLAELIDDLLGRTRDQATAARRQKFAGLGAMN